MEAAIATLSDYCTTSLTGGSRDGHGAACLPPFSKGKKKQDKHLLHLSSCHYITSFLFARLNPPLASPFISPFSPLFCSLLQKQKLYMI